jgi:hypothetical protein
VGKPFWESGGGRHLGCCWIVSLLNNGAVNAGSRVGIWGYLY